jgi:hypothetical protein
MLASGNKYFNDGSPGGFLCGKGLPDMSGRAGNMTRSGGNTIAGNRNAVTAGARGPLKRK